MSSNEVTVHYLFALLSLSNYTSIASSVSRALKLTPSPVQQERYGQMCWLAIPVIDIERAVAFYSQIFPWDISPNGVPHQRPGVKELYFFNGGDTLHGAFYVMEDGFHVINHSIDFQDGLSVHPSFNVRNCKETLELVEKLGGKTQLHKSDLGGNMGHYARFIDTEDNMIGIWSKI